MSEQDLNQVEAKKIKVVYTTKEIAEMGVPCKHLSPPEEKQCKYCGKTLYHEGVIFMGSVVAWSPLPQRCNCEKALAYWKKHDEEEEKRKAMEASLEREREERGLIERRIARSGIKQRFHSRTFESFKVNPQNKAAFNKAKDYTDKFEEYSQKGRGLSFEGTYGTGKTHLAVAIALDLIKKGRRVICKTSIDMFSEIKRSYDNSYLYSEHEIIDRYCRAELLIIDDLGKEQVTEWSMPILYTILNDRYEELRPTIITTNYNEEDLVKRLTPRNGDNYNAAAIISRFRESNDIVTMAWDDYRNKEWK